MKKTLGRHLHDRHQMKAKDYTLLTKAAIPTLPMIEEWNQLQLTDSLKWL